jgi:hypothetical protein
MDKRFRDATSDTNAFAMRPLGLGPESNGYYSVLDGVTVGDRIVTMGRLILRVEWLKSHTPSQMS